MSTHLGLALSTAAVLLSWLGPPAGPGVKTPTSVIATYKCAPESRLELRAHLESRTLVDLERWKTEDRLADYLVLSSLDLSKHGWDFMFVLDFADPEQVEAWREIHRATPNGLSREALRLAASVETERAELVWQGASPNRQRSPRTVYWVRPYRYKDRKAYKQYFEAHNVPQFQAWFREGALEGYRVFLSQEASGNAWDVLFIYEYQDLEFIRRRDAVKDTVEAELKKSPSWALLDEDDIKSPIRTGGRITLAEPVLRK